MAASNLIPLTPESAITDPGLRFDAVYVAGGLESENIRDRVKEICNGGGADVVFNPVGGTTFEASLRCVNWGARLVVVGFAGGQVPQVPANILLVKNIAAIRFY